MNFLFEPFPCDYLQFNAERLTVGQELYVVITPSKNDRDCFGRVLSMIGDAVRIYLSMYPEDKYLARFAVQDDEYERWYEVQFKDRDKLLFPRWQQMLVSPYANSREAA